MRKGKYVIAGIFILAVAWAAGGFAIYKFFYCLGKAHLTHYFFEMFAWIAVFLVAGVGGTWLGFLQMKAPADPKPEKVLSSLDVEDCQIKSLMMLLKADFKNINDFKSDYLKITQNKKYSISYCELVYHYWINGKKDIARFDFGGEAFLLKPEDLYLIPTDFEIIKAEKAEKSKFWLGSVSSQNKRYDLTNFTLLYSEKRRIRILFSGYLTSLTDIEEKTNLVMNSLKEKAKTMTDEELYKAVEELAK